jgi:hypothetical protein
MRSSFFSAIVLAALPALGGCGYSVFDAAEDISNSSSGLTDGKSISGNWADTGSFTELAALGPDKIVYTTGDKFQIRAEADAETLGKLRFKLDDGKLLIGRVDKKWGSSKAATVYVTAPSLANISLAGSGSLTADKLSGDKVSISTAGSGGVDVAAIEAKSLSAELAGSGSFKAAGTATSADYSIAGSGSVDAAKLSSTNAKVSIAGSGDVALSASGTVDASIAGSGDVNVIGGAKCTKSVIGSGKVNCG